MRRKLLASLGAALALCIWVGNAAADTGSAASMTAAGPRAPSDPTLDAFGLVSQHVPEFGAAAEPAVVAPDVAPDEDAVVAPEPAPDEAAGTSQANGSDAGSLAANGNETGQAVDQEQGGGDALYPAVPVPATEHDPAKVAPTPGSTQVAGQSADSTQTADATASSTQIEPTNESASIRVLSPGDDGPVTQSNDSVALAGALNGNDTTQDLGQSQGGSGSGTQIAGQSAKNDQWANADADAKQIAPSNKNISVRVLSPGDDGDVSQSNTNVAGALAANGNSTGQGVDQSQGGSGGGTQVAGQKADNKQSADATADAIQVHPENTNISVRILSPGDNGSVSQSNTNVAGALAANVNSTCQCITQNQAGGPGGSSTQIAGQSASSEQDATADATAKQIKPKNENISVRVLSPGADGSVSQSNTNIALSGALNANKTTQGIDQSKDSSYPSKDSSYPSKDGSYPSKDGSYPSKDGSYPSKDGSAGTGLQVAGQKAWSNQDAASSATADQVAPSNLSVPVRVLSPGDSGSVEQSNTVLAGALGANLNGTAQTIDQDQSGGSGGPYVQAAGQFAGNEQSADADADATQCCASNVNAPVGVESHGDGGSVRQSNDVAALALGLNLNGTHQSIEQSQGGGSGGTAIQAAGQKATNDQDAYADADAVQIHPSNVNAALRVLDKPDRCDWHKACKRPDTHPKKDDPCSDCKRPEPCKDWDGCKPHDPCEYGDDCKQREHDQYDRCKPHDPCEYGDDGKQREPDQYDRCKPHDPCEYGDDGKQRKPDRHHRCKSDEPRKHSACPRQPRCEKKHDWKKDPCRKWDRCEWKNPCDTHSAPTPRSDGQGLVPMR